MHKINICEESKVWAKHCSSIDKKIKQILKRSIESEKIFRQKNIEITVLLTSSNKMKFLNHKFRRINKDTDVLSFPYERPYFMKRKLLIKIFIWEILLCLIII